MISFIRGPLAAVEEDGIVVEAGGVGFEIRVPASVLDRLPALGQEIKIYTYFQVREDGMSLYGFQTVQDRQIFRQLLGVNGIGPKGALGILSALKPDELRMAIVSGDAKAIAKAPGVGVKTAQRIILDLKDKISMDQVTRQWLEASGQEGDLPSGSGAEGLAGAAREAVEALVALGYTGIEASRAVKKVELAEGMTAEDVLKASLRHLSFL
ncbi:MAG TPA: Holliday junction branch migration protein RuvA [Candidatus Cottocaccamicrobium excrementipullorum]|nr:Holliday junction branch migration protein RuvA [Candidatus Cottocaccamicrobium excrementipullorum]